MMNRLLLLPLLLIAALPACQAQRNKEIIEDQDRQLDTLQSERSRLMSERDRIRVENAALQESLTVEQMRAQELNSRLMAMEADMQASDSELDELRDELGGLGIAIGRRAGFVVLELPQSITFPSGRADLSAQGKKSLQAVTNVLNERYSENTYWVEGHTDNDPISKSGWRSNLHLSLMRALAVAEYLTKDLDVSADKVRVSGYGEYAPKVDNSDPKNKASNRRVEILILD